jgi:FdhE protein
MNQVAWIEKHPYLQPVADLHRLVDAALEEISVPSAHVPSFDDFIDEFHVGVPLLLSSTIATDFAPVVTAVTSVVERLALQSLPGNLTEEVRALHGELHRKPNNSLFGMDWLFDMDSFVPTPPRLLQYLGWTVAARYLRPIVDAFSEWRDEDRWLRNYCPTCGTPPAMGQLVGTDPGRLRLLSCGRCSTRWRYRRTGCPFCENQDDHRLTALAIEGECGLRIDCCEACGGYLKSYIGEGSERVLLADWTSLHLDIVARDRGLKRFAASLYQL